MEAMIGYERIIILDAVWSPDGEVGKVLEFDAGHLPDTLNTASVHDADLPTSLRVGRELGAELPANEHIQIIGVLARTVLDFGSEPTPPVAAAIPEVTSRVLALLDLQPIIDPYSLSPASCWRL
jgi:hydrogenase maturation protease